MGAWQKDLWEGAGRQAWQGAPGRLARAQSRGDKCALICWMLVQVRPAHGSKPVLLNQGQLCPSGDTAHCLEMVWVVTTEGQCWWHLVGRTQDAAESCRAQDSSPSPRHTRNKDYLAPNANSQSWKQLLSTRNVAMKGKGRC